MDLSQFTSYLQLFSSFLVALTGAVVAVGAIIRPVRKWIVGILSKEKEYKQLESSVNDVKQTLSTELSERKLMKEAYICLTRNALTEIWHRAEEQGYICDWDRENFDRMYAAYSALGGNSYIHEAHAQILKLPSKPKKTRKTTKKTKR
ncbi:MAG: hypothetical protein IKA48_02560 [Fibrobacter sp.]|nr:hypothetical protein [Fibrobacter sp.]